MDNLPVGMWPGVNECATPWKQRWCSKANQLCRASELIHDLLQHAKCRERLLETLGRKQHMRGQRENLIAKTFVHMRCPQTPEEDFDGVLRDAQCCALRWSSLVIFAPWSTPKKAPIGDAVGVAWVDKEVGQRVLAEECVQRLDGHLPNDVAHEFVAQLGCAGGPGLALVS